MHLVEFIDEPVHIHYVHQVESCTRSSIRFCSDVTQSYLAAFQISGNGQNRKLFLPVSVGFHRPGVSTRLMPGTEKGLSAPGVPVSSTGL